MSYTPSSVKDEPSTDSTNSIGGWIVDNFLFFILCKTRCFSTPPTTEWNGGRKEGIKSLTNNSYPEFTKFPRPNLRILLSLSLFKRRRSIPPIAVQLQSTRSVVCVVIIYSLLLERIGYVAVSLPSAHAIHRQEVRRKNEDNAIKWACNTDIHPVDARQFI